MSTNTPPPPPPPDTLAIVLQTVREELLRQAPANDPHYHAAHAALVDDALAEAELRARRILGGARHYIQRLPALERLNLVELMPASLSAKQIAERLGLSESTVRRMLARSKGRAGR